MRWGRQLQGHKEIQLIEVIDAFVSHCTQVQISSITSHCSGKEPPLLRPPKAGEGRPARHEKGPKIKPNVQKTLKYAQTENEHTEIKWNSNIYRIHIFSLCYFKISSILSYIRLLLVAL